MKIPKRLLIMKRLEALLLAAPIEIDGVEHDLAGKIVRGKSLIGDEVTVPLLAILESPRPDFAQYAGEEKLTMFDNLTLLIQGRCTNDAVYPSDPAYWFSAAVIERLSWIEAEKKSSQMPLHPEHYKLGNIITSMEVAPPVVRPPEDKSSAWAFFYLVVRFGVAGDIANQYTQVS